MPDPPKENESREEFVKRCVPEVIREGRKANQAVAICNAIFDRDRKI